MGHRSLRLHEIDIRSDASRAVVNSVARLIKVAGIEPSFVSLDGVRRRYLNPEDEGESHHFVVRNWMGRVVAAAGLDIHQDVGSTDKTGTVDYLAVAPNRQHEGLGSGVLRHLEDVARVRGATSIELGSLESAEGFYQKMGYEKTVRHDGSLTIVRFQKPLV